MVSLETKADRTLFFDLLPLEVGTIAGFKTKIQLYTVPGQVFYNTTRKLVLKGVDGIVFVADSQRPMLPSNVESIGNLETNLAELGIDMDGVPLVLQYNKRDLNDVCSVEELDRAINQREVPSVEASALAGGGVFETLRAISRQTLGALKKQLEEGSHRSSGPSATLKQAAKNKPVASPAAAARAAASPVVSPSQVTLPSPGSSEPQSAHPVGRAVSVTSSTQPTPNGVEIPASNETEGVAAPTNGRRKTSRDLLLQLNRTDMMRVRKVSLNLRVEDEADQLVHEVRDLKFDLGDPASANEMLLQLNILLDSNG
jgi:signal recognition particle receptor subunit beta